MAERHWWSPEVSLGRGIKKQWMKGPFEEIMYERIDQYSKGYPRLATFYNSDPDFRVFRRFGALRNRLILHRQYELVVLEKKLFKLDNADSETHAYRNQSIHRDKADEQSEREILNDEINRKLKEYDDINTGTLPRASVATKQTPGAPLTPAEVQEDVSILGKSKMLELQSANKRRKLLVRQAIRAFRKRIPGKLEREIAKEKKLKELHRELQGLQGFFQPQNKQTLQVRILFKPGINTQAGIQASSDSSKVRLNASLGTYNEYWSPKSGCGVNGTLKVLSSGLVISLLASPAAGCPDVETIVRLGQPIFGGAAGLSGFTILGLEADPKVPSTIRWLFFGIWCLFIGPFLYCMSSSVPRGKRASYIVATGIVTAFLVGVFSQMMMTTLDGISTWTPFISVASIVGVYLWYDKRHGTQRIHPLIGNAEDGNDTELRVSVFNRHQDRTSTALEVVPNGITAAAPAQTLAQTASGSSIQQSQYGEIDPTSLAENSPLIGGNDHESLTFPELGEASHAPHDLPKLAVSGSAIPATYR